MKRYAIIGFVTLTIAVSVAAYVYSTRPNQLEISQTEQSNTPSPTPTLAPTSISTKLLFSGDVFWSRKTDFWAQNSPAKYSHPFEKLITFHPEDYDSWIANLECPITTHKPTQHELEDLLKFNCHPDYTPEAAKFFDVFSLATNHTDNQNEIDGFAKTKQYLAENNIKYFGHYDNKIDEICQAILFPARTLDGTDQIIEDTTFPVALCGYHYVFRTPREGEIETIATYANAMPTIAIPHMGEEYTPEPDQLKQSIYRQMIDAGAIAVIGSHPHWVQITEVYQGSLIAYSLGNFIFDQRWNDELMRGAVLDMELSAKSPALSSWLDVANNCTEFNDACLTQLAQHYDASNVAISYGVRSADSTGQQTIRGDEKLDQWVKDRMRWSETLLKLGQ